MAATLAMFGQPAAEAVGPQLEDRFVVLSDLSGRGFYGNTDKVRDRVTGEVFQRKRLSAEDLGEWSVYDVNREVSLLRDFAHPNVVQLYGIYTTGASNVGLLYEYMQNDLRSVLKNHRNSGVLLPMPVLVRYAQELLRGIHACHARLIVHGDLRPQTILLDRHGLKICNFEAAKKVPFPSKVPYTEAVAVIWFRPPELLLGAKEYGTEVDTWSAGCIIGEMAAGFAMFPGESEIGTLFKIFQLLGTPKEETLPALTSLKEFKPTFPQWPSTNLECILAKRPELEQPGLDLISGLLCMNPQTRLSAGTAKRHGFFAQQATRYPIEDQVAMAAVLATEAP